LATVGWCSLPLSGAAAALIHSVSAAISLLQVRAITRQKTSTALIFDLVFSSLLTLSTVLLDWVGPGGTDLALLAGIGVLGGLGQILVTFAYRSAKVFVVAAFDYASLI
jgi:hypothetical protein